ncbi:MAG: hypothetical protein C0507_04890 [Cyanobacteria bacterium PR.3.49]|nr:hypothetical protein [Cyanobacteria bacterium PR.3.49]
MQIRVIRATSSLVAFLAAFFMVAVNDSHAQDSFRIERPSRPQAPAATGTTQSETQSQAQSETQNNSDCRSPCCSPSAESGSALTSSLPAEGLFARWRTEFINPTVCPVRLCHGSCKRSSISCRIVKTKIDSLLDAYIPEEVPVEALLNFRCCAGFTED